MAKRYLGCLAILICFAGCEADSREVVLFDFEQGDEGWSGNPWKGGKCLVETTDDARFGAKALHAWYEGTPKKDGGNVISPYPPADVAWRKQPWGVISLWAKGDGSASSVRLILEEDAKEHPTFSKSIPLDSKEWRRFSFALRSFWNRGKRKIDPAKFKRLYFGGTPNQSLLVDRVAFEAAHREIPLEAAGAKAGLPFDDVNVVEYRPGEYDVRLIPPRKPTQASVNVTVCLSTKEGQKAEKTLQVQFGPDCDEVTVPLSVPVKKDTTVTLRISAKGASGKAYAAQFEFPVFPLKPLDTSPYLCICPQPKEMAAGNGCFSIGPGTKIVAISPTSGGMGYCTALLQSELKKWYGLDLKTASDGGEAGNIVLRLRDVGLPKEGHLLSVKPTGVTLCGKDCRALYNGIQTLLQVIAESTDVPRTPRAKCVEIKDWPSVAMRSAMIGLPVTKWGHPNDPDVKVEDFLDFLYNTIVRHKMNTLVLNMGHGYRYACAPKVGAKHAWGRADLEKIREFCKRHFIEIIPNVNSMGHTGWLLYKYKELRWHNDINMLCTCNPKSYEIMTSVYDELIGIFQPRIFHIGMDEVRWRGGKDPKPCGCDKVPTWEQFGRWVTKLHGHLKARGVRTMMWGDMLLIDHNAGPPFFTGRALKDVPRDIMMANWSSSVAPGSNFFFNKTCGFRDVLEANSSGVNANQSPYVMGNMFGVWGKAPWLSQRDAAGTQRYSYLGLIQGAEFSWNLNRTGRDVTKRYDPEYFKSREAGVLRELASEPEPQAGKDMTPIDISSAANSRVAGIGGGNAEVSRIAFTLLPDGRCVEVKPGETKTISIGKPAASLYFLHAEALPEGKGAMKTFRDRWKDKDNIWGIPAGRYEIVYEDGSTAALPIKHSWNILPRQMPSTLPYAYRVIGSHRLAGDSPAQSDALYAAQWVNPNPGKAIKEIRMVGGDTEATLHLFAVTAKGR